MLTMIEVNKAATLCTLQDLGRHGYRHLGIGSAGAIDALALKLANIMVGNEPQATCLEMVLPKVSLTFHTPAMVALCGQGGYADIAGRRYWSGSRFYVQAGTCVKINGTRMGLSCYLAVAGGLAVSPVMNSTSTDVRCGIGPEPGRPLQRGDQIPLARQRPSPMRSLMLRMPVWDPLWTVVPGPEWSLLGKSGQAAFLRQSWRISNDSDRTGVRLIGRPVKFMVFPEMRSHGVFPGLIQLPADGQPILLSADAQATGGYPRLALISDANLWKLGQALPGTRVQFMMQTPEEAAAALALQQRYLKRIQLAVQRAG